MSNEYLIAILLKQLEYIKAEIEALKKEISQKPWGIYIEDSLAWERKLNAKEHEEEDLRFKLLVDYDVYVD